MFYLLLAIVSSALVSVIMRLSTDKVKADVGMLAMNYMTALILSLLTGGFAVLGGGLRPGFGPSALMGAVNGVLYMVSLVSFQSCVKKNGVVLSSVFMKLGILVPMLLSTLVFGEKPSLPQLAGFLLALVSIMLINRGDGESKGSFKAGLIFLLLFSGSAEGMSKVFEQLGSPELSGLYFMLTFTVALLLCLVRLAAAKQRVGRYELLYGCLIGIPNFMSARFLLLALVRMPAVIVYPSYSVGTILLVTLTGVAAFKERLRKLQWFAIGLIAAALVLLNI